MMGLKRNFPQILAVVSGTLGTIADGMQYAWTSPIVPLLQKKDSSIVINPTDIFWMESIYFFGGIVSLPLTVFILNKLGRKSSILIAAVENLIAWILIGTATSVTQILIGRFLAGFTSVVAFVSIPMYTAEIADKKIRGLLGSSVSLMLMFGILLVYTVAPHVSILASSSLGAAFVVLLLLTFPFMPESPYYLLLKGKKDEAEKSLQFFRHGDDIELEFFEMQKAVNRQQSERGRFVDLFCVSSNRKAIIIIGVLNAAQQFSGITVILMNLEIILTQARSACNPSTLAIFLAISMLTASSISACVMDKLGRKFLLVVSSVLTGTCLVVLGVYFCYENIMSPWTPVIDLILYAVVYRFGLGLIPIVTAGELFPTSVKGYGMTLSDFMTLLFSNVSVFAFHFLTINFGMSSPFMMFGICAFCTTVFSYLYIPETSGKTLEEIQMILKGNSCEKPLIDNNNFRYGST